MGANASKSVENVTNKINTRLSQTAGTSATATCEIQNGNILFTNAQGCSLTNQNQCGATAAAAISSISQASAEAWADANSAQKTAILPGVNVNETQQNVQNIIEQKIYQNCQANTAATLTIATKDIVLNKCLNSHIYNVNTGNAQASCGVTSVIDAINKAAASTDNNQSTGDIFGSLFGGIASLGLAVPAVSSGSCFILVICCVIIIVGFMALSMSGQGSSESN